MIFIAIFGMEAMVFGAVSPLQTVLDTTTSEATNYILPLIIFFILAAGAVLSFVMKGIMPLIYALGAAALAAMSPNLAAAFPAYFG